MQPVLLVIIVGLLGGIAVGAQAPILNMISQRLGSMESVFIVHFGGAVLSGLILLAQRGGALAQWQTLPWFTLLAGAFGLVVVSAINFTIPRLGATTTTALIVAGQLVIGVLIDHFGILNVTVRPLDLGRIVGIIVLFAGVYLLIR
jgi:transporter family-2 protein